MPTLHSGFGWAAVGQHPDRRLAWGRPWSILALFFLGGVVVTAAFGWADGLATLGLAAGWLVTGLFWERPRPIWEGAEALSLSREM